MTDPESFREDRYDEAKRERAITEAEATVREALDDLIQARRVGPSHDEERMLRDAIDDLIDKERAE